jgi:hypothetical protein
LLLCAWLFAWEPLKLAGEASAASGTLSMRGAEAVVELAAQTAAAIAHAAAWIVYLRKSRRVRAAYD